METMGGGIGYRGVCEWVLESGPTPKGCKLALTEWHDDVATLPVKMGCHRCGRRHSAAAGDACMPERTVCDDCGARRDPYPGGGIRSRLDESQVAIECRCDPL